MTVMLGEYALSAAMLTALAVVFAAFMYYRTENPGLIRAMRWGLGLLAGLLSLSSWGLLSALIDDNFTLKYVGEHSERALALGYKLAAFWAGQEGSLLFWAWVLGLMGLVMAFRSRRNDDGQTAISLATMAAVTCFFTIVMLFAGNPFDVATPAPADGHGLNPALQNLAMVVHPPMLFLGYAGFTAPFALMLGALISGRRDNLWLREARLWMVYSWTVLSVGILLGAQWAYVELGWGGYWAWDPVENASLLPWLTGTALLHSAVLATSRGMFKRWTAWLTAASFLLCIFGTYLTRSGIIQSVHGFEESDIGTYFLIFMILVALAGIITIVARRSLLQAEHKLEALVSREGLFLFINVLLVSMTIITTLGTMSPLISRLFSDTPHTAEQPFYNMVVLPMGLAVAALMCLGPTVGYGAAAARRASGRLIIVGLVAACGAVATALVGHVWTLAATGLPGLISAVLTVLAGAAVAAVVSAFLIDIITMTRTMSRIGGDNVRAAALKALSGRSRHWGAQLAHLGLAAIVVGIVGSSVYRMSEKVTGFKVGESRQLGDYTLTYVGAHDVERANHAATVVTTDITNNKTGEHFQLLPELRQYESGQASHSAIRLGLLSDVYLTLLARDETGAIAFELYINPLINWIWIGGGLLTLGGLVCLIPGAQRRLAGSKSAPQTQDALPVAAPPAGHTARERRRALQLQRPLATGGNT